MANNTLLFSLTQAKKSPPKKSKPSLESSSDDEAVVRGSCVFPRMTHYSPTTYRIILDSYLFILVVNYSHGFWGNYSICNQNVSAS